MSRLSNEFRDRTKRYASRVVKLFVTLSRGQTEVQVIGRQLLRAGTSVAAHTREASRARSNAEFCSKVEGALQEADESQLWLELLREDCGITDASVDWLLQESNELIAIFVTMVSKVRNPSL